MGGYIIMMKFLSVQKKPAVEVMVKFLSNF